MLKCPTCTALIPKHISIQGGNCPQCGELILPFGDDFEHETSDTEERMPITEEVEKTELHILDFDDSELEPTELMHNLPLRKPQGTMLDSDYQEDFPDDSFLDEEECIAIPNSNRAVNKSSSNFILIGVLCGVIGILGGYIYQVYTQPQVILDNVSTTGLPSFRQAEMPKPKPKPKEKVEPEKSIETKTKAKTKKRYTQKKEPLDPTIESALALRTKTFRSCVDRAKMKKKSLQATVRYSLVIEKSGQVSKTKIRVKGDSLESFERCLNKQISRWRFPKIEKSVRIDRSFQVNN